MDIESQIITKEEALRLKFRKDYKFLRFYLLPFMKDFSADARWMAEKIGVPVEQAFEYQDLLLDTEYWIRTASGSLSAKENLPRFKKNFDDFLTAAEFMTLNANISTRITDTGPCWYETFTIATTKELETEFVQKLNSLLNDFRKKSEEVPGEIMISWAQVYTHALNGTSSTKEEQL